MGATTPEGLVKAGIKKVLNDMGAWYFMPTMAGYGRAGIPDFIVCLKGRFLAIEAKRPGGKTTAWQDRELAAIQAAGGEAMVINDPETLREMLAEISHEG